MLHALTVFVSAFLLFLVQPLIAKQILPWFGGTASVWTVCLVFFQLVLLVGYAYADWLSRLALRRQAIIHTVLLILACAMLPVIPDFSWKPVDGSDPTLRILLLLLATIGLPYMAVCTTGPLLQSWYSRLRSGEKHQSNVYRLFALSNFASLVSLVMYPFIVEPFTTVRVQAWVWSVGFVFFAVLAMASAWLTVSKARLVSEGIGGPPDSSKDGGSSTETAAQVAPTLGHHLFWLVLSGLGTVSLLSVTTHITQDVAAVPFMWIVPLALYLLTFVLCFDSAFWYRRWIFLPAVVALVPALGWALFDSTQGPVDLRGALLLFCGGLFVLCMFLHGELAGSKPAPAYLTRFYLMISVGGALGGLFVGLIAPRIFDGYWELPGAVLICGLLVWYIARAHIKTGLFLFVAVLFSALAWFLYQYIALPQIVGVLAMLGVSYAALVGWRSRSLLAGVGLLGVLTTLGSAYFVVSYLQVNQRSLLVSNRNFYGTLRVKQIEGEGSLAGAKHRMLYHGIIIHGEQSEDETRRRVPTTYFGSSSGVGLAIEHMRSQQANLHIGVIGLGIGTLAAYGKSGDVLRFYEINPDVVDFANQYFSYLRDSGAKIETVLGDARLAMESEAANSDSQKFDILVVDAFSGDSIPVHLLTRESMDIYKAHLNPGGVIAFHVSNRYLNLPPVVEILAKDAGMRSARIDDQHQSNSERLRTSVYVLVSRNEVLFNDQKIATRVTPIQAIPGLQGWTDDYNNLFQILK